MMDGTNKNNVNINDENYYPFCLTPSEHTLVYLPSEQRGGGWKDIKAASVPLIIEYITRIDYHGMLDYNIRKKQKQKQITTLLRLPTIIN